MWLLVTENKASEIDASKLERAPENRTECRIDIGPSFTLSRADELELRNALGEKKEEKITNKKTKFALRWNFLYAFKAANQKIKSIECYFCDYTCKRSQESVKPEDHFLYIIRRSYKYTMDPEWRLL